MEALVSRYDGLGNVCLGFADLTPRIVRVPTMEKKRVFCGDGVREVVQLGRGMGNNGRGIVRY